MSAVSLAAARLYRIPKNAPRAGITDSGGHHFGDCYMIYFLTQVAGVRHVSPRAARAQYQGAERDIRFSAMLSPVAFSGWTGPLAHLRVPPEPR